MRYEDFIEKEIQKLSRVLSELLSFILKSKKIESNETVFKLVNKTLVEEINLSIYDLSKLKIEELIQIKGLKSDNLEILAGLFIELGENIDIENKNEYFIQSLNILKYIDLESHTFSFERFSNIEKLNQLIEIKN